MSRWLAAVVAAGAALGAAFAVFAAFAQAPPRAGVAAVAAEGAAAVGAPAGSTVAAAAELRSRFSAASRQASRKLSDRPIWLFSQEGSEELRGDVFAVVEQRYADVRQALASARPWCDVLILHLNIKYCRLGGVAGREVVEVGFGRKLDASLSALQWLRFDYRAPAANDELLRVEMKADSGPMSTSDYRIVVEATALTERQTVLHFGYAYRYGAAARLATRAYLATAGRDKVGFTVTGRSADGQPEFIGGTLGVLERNTMRYFLAVEAFLAAERTPQAERQERRLAEWFVATERYARQLHEIDRDDYLQMKRMELRRQETTSPPPGS